MSDLGPESGEQPGKDPDNLVVREQGLNYPQSSDLENELTQIHAALEVSSAGTFSWNERDFTFTWSPGCYRLHGFAFDKQTITYRDFFSRIPDDVRGSLEAKVIASRDEHSVFDTIYPVRWPNGETHWIHSRGVWDYEDDGAPVRLFGIGLDADERVTTQVQLAASEERLRASQEASQVGSWELELETDQLTLSETCARLHGYTDIVITSAESLELVVAADRSSVMRGYERAKQPDGFYDVQYRITGVGTQEGEPRWIHGRGKGIFDENGRVLRIIGTDRDVTDRRRAELAFVDTARTFRTLTQASPALVFRADEAGKAIFFNSDRWQEFSGRGPDAWRGSKWMDAFHPEEQELIERAWRDAVEAQQEFRGEYRWQHADGRDRWILFHALPVYGEEGFSGFVGTGTDITALKISQGERATLQIALAESQKMEAVGTLASGVAHDFNNLLAAVKGYVELARLELKPKAMRDDDAGESKAAGFLIQAELAIDQARDVTRGLLTFARGSGGISEPLCINELVAQNVEFLRQLVPASIDIRLSLDNDELWVHGDSTELKQVLINLLVNSRDAMSDGGSLEVKLKRRDGRANLIIADDGIGMDEATRSRVFDPFFTTKEQGEGTGLGLSVVHGIIQSHGGEITVSSELGVGTVVEITLPLCEPVMNVPVEQIAQSQSPAICRVLLVEDNDLVRESFMLRIEVEGFTVVQAASGGEAIEIFARAPNAIDVAILDVDLPDLTGVKVASELRAVRGSLPVLYITGNVQNDALANALATDPVFAKPVDYEALIAQVQSLFEVSVVQE